MKTSTKATLSGISCIIMWSMSGVLVTYITRQMPAIQTGALSLLGGFITMVLYWKWRREKILPKFRMTTQTYALGLYGVGCYTILWMLSLKLAPPLEANTLNYLWPAMLIVFSALAAKKLPTMAAVIGCCICFTGSCFLFARDGLLEFDSAHFWGLVAGVVAAVIWGSYSTLTKFVKFQSDRIAVFCLISGLLMWPLHLYFEETVWPQSPQIALAIVVYGISRVTFILWDYAMKEGQTTLLASLSYFTPLLSILCLTLAGFATYTFHVTVGAVMIIAGCIVINLPQMIQAVRKRKAAANP